MKLRKIASAALASLMLAGTAVTGAVTAFAADGFPFTDVPEGEWYRGYVEYVYKNDLMNGIDNDKFGPSKDLSRAMFVTIIGRLHGMDANGKATDAFPDTDKNTWYSPYVGWAADNKIVGGYDDGTFRPDAPVSREEAAVIVDRYVKKYNLSLTRVGGMFEFADQDTVQDWAADSLSIMRNTGLMLGDDNRNFNPQSSITRAEAAAVIMRLKEAKENVWKGYAPSSDDDSIILGAKYLYWTGSLVAGGMAHTLGEYGGYPTLQASMDENYAAWTYLEPNTIGVSIHYLDRDMKNDTVAKTHSVVKVCYTNSMSDGIQVLYSANKTLKEETKVTVHEFLTPIPGADENGMKTAIIDLSVIEEKYPDLDYTWSLANLVFMPCDENYTGSGTFDIRYIGFFNDEDAAAAFSASSDAEISDYLKNYKPYTNLNWNELTDDIDQKYADMLAERIKKIKNAESELTPEMIEAAGGKCWYVSSINGNDNNDGSTPDKAVKSIYGGLYQKKGPVMACKAKAGDGVFFERGSVFYPEIYRSASTVALTGEDGVSYGAYGVGAKPLFTNALDFSGTNNVGTWTLVPGSADVYELDPELIDKDPDWRNYVHQQELSNIIFNGGEAVGIRMIPTTISSTEDLSKPVFGEGLVSWDKGYLCNGYEYRSYPSHPMTDATTALSGYDLTFVYDGSEGRLFLCSTEGNPADRFDDIKVARMGSCAAMGNDTHVDNLAFMHTSRHCVTAGGYNVKYTNCEVGYAGGCMESAESGIEIYGNTDGAYFYNNYIHDIMDGLLTSQNTDSGDVKEPTQIQNLEYIGNVMATSGAGAEIWNSGPVDENGYYKSRMTNITVKDNFFAYQGYGITQMQDKSHNTRGSVLCGSMYGEISHSIFEGNIAYHPNGEIYQCYMATYEQPRGWQALRNTVIAPVGNLNSNIGFCYETLNYINHGMWKRARVAFRYDYETMVWYTGQGIDPQGTYYWYKTTNPHEKMNCFFTTGYYIERGGFKPTK